MSDNEFWDIYVRPQAIGADKFRSLQDLTDMGRAAKALNLPAQAGQRVAFVPNIGSVLTVDHVPTDGVLGTVLMVRTAEGHMTGQEGRAFVKWDDGAFEAVPAEFLQAVQAKAASSLRRVGLSLMDLTDFTASDKTSELIHKSTNDLWSFDRQDEGYTITRLFSDDGQPLKG